MSRGVAGGRGAGVILASTVFAFATLYVPQPILPRLAAEFGVSPTAAGLLIAATMVPLGVAPLVYGYLVEAVSAKRLLRVALALLALNQALYPLFDSYHGMLTLRFAQGLLLPGAFTALVTYSANMAGAERVRHAVSYYIAATIVGGFAGRLIGGLGAELLDWRWTYALLAVALAGCWLASARLAEDARGSFDRIDARAFRAVLSWPGYARGYLGLALVFGVFASVLNFVPFRLKEIAPAMGESMVALVYVGYVSGALLAFAAPRLTGMLGGDLRGIATGAAIYLLGLTGLLLPGVAATFAAMLVMCAGFFLLHTLLSAFLNHAAPRAKGVVNGLYISFYYTGGALGAWLPGFILGGYGWTAYLLSMLGVFALGAVALAGLRGVRSVGGS